MTMVMTGEGVGAAFMSTVRVGASLVGDAATGLTVSPHTTVTRDTSTKNSVTRVLGTASEEGPSWHDY